MGKWITQVISPQVEYQRYENKVRARDSRLYTRKHSLLFSREIYISYYEETGSLTRSKRHITVKKADSNSVLFLLYFHAKNTYSIVKGQVAQVVERHISVKVTSSNLVLFLLYFMKGEFL